MFKNVLKLNIVKEYSKVSRTRAHELNVASVLKSHLLAEIM
jgi:hypothetical protein